MAIVAVHTSSWESFAQLVTVLLIFVFVLAVTYFVTRFIARHQAGVTVGRNISVVETFRIANNKYVQILEVGSAYFVIAVCKDTVTLLGEVDKEELSWLPDRDAQSSKVNENFQEILQKVKNKLPRK